MTRALTEAQRRIVSGRAQGLFTRVDSPDAFVYEEADESASELLDAWRELFPSDEAFEERLDRAGLTVADFERAARVSALRPGEAIPEWVDRLEALIDSVQSRDPDEIDPESRLDVDARRPFFGELTSALASHIVDGLPDDSVGDVLSASAKDSIAGWFHSRFVDRFSRLFYVEFKSFVASRDEELAFADPEDFDDPPTEYYDEFVDHLFSTGFSTLCVDYPVFARMLSMQARQVTEHVTELVNRLRADRKPIANRFDFDGEGDVVSELVPLADDTHGDGRAVTRVTFESGDTVVYKPRCVESGAAFYRLIDRLETHLPIPDFGSPTFLSRPEYGWMEWISYAECDDHAAVERYYQRAGALLCLAYLLGATDCHFENLIVSGENPILVDAETLFHPQFEPERQPKRTDVRALVDGNVLGTGLVPYRIDRPYSGSTESLNAATAGIALSSDEATVDGASRPTLKAVNTDVLSVDQRLATVDRSENVPKVDGVEQPPDRYLDSIETGFERTYESILRLRASDRLSDVLGIDDAFRSAENRLVYRPTEQYAKVLRSLRSRDCLGDGLRFDVEVDRLAVPLCTDNVPDPPWGLFRAEREAVRRYDPPRFSSRVDAEELFIDGRSLSVTADEPGISRARRRLANASRDDMNEQLALVRNAFGGSPASTDVGISTSSADRVAVGDERLRDEAIALFEAVRDAATVFRDGRYYWSSIAPRSEDGPAAVRAADGSLFVGRCGIALFAAGLYDLTGEREYRELALDAVQPVRRMVADGVDAPSLTSLGGTLGLGSVAYGLVTVGDLVGERAVVEDGVRTSTHLTGDLVAADDVYDVTLGAAGTILGFLGAADRTGSSELLRAAERCGDHLLASATRTADGTPVWHTLDDTTPLTGYAHGVAGIAYALGRLASATGDEQYRSVALDALDFEATAFSESSWNWPDTRKWTSETHLDRWCYGRSGIGLARLGMAEYVSDDRVERGFDRAIRGAPSTGLGDRDHLCCGNAGRAEFLLEAQRRRGERAGAARKIVGGALCRKEEHGSYRTAAEADHVTDPTLFNGLAGIGYTMLRVTAPERLPSVLLWE
jgi:type 2 lantibiotic biosynthesis protein LanM